MVATLDELGRTAKYPEPRRCVRLPERMPSGKPVPGITPWLWQGTEEAWRDRQRRSKGSAYDILGIKPSYSGIDEII